MLAKHLYVRFRGRRVSRFLSDARRSREVQHRVLLDKLRRNADSDFGRAHGFAEIRSVDDFRGRVPVTTYDYYSDYVERVKRGDIQAMFGPGTKVLMFALTSGTTGQSKAIPVTGEAFREYRYGWNLWGLRNYRDHSDLLRKKTLKLSSDWQQFRTPSGIPCGNISGLVSETMPLVGRDMFIIPHAVSKIHDHASKQYTALRVALASRRVGMIATANPSTLVEFAKLADTRRQSLLRDICDGTLSDELDVPSEVRRDLRRHVSRPDPSRARELERMIDRNGGLYPRDFWPGLSVLAVWTGGSVGVYLPQMEPLYGKVTLRDHGLHASEGRMTIPLEDGTSAGVLDFVNNYFEFIPEDEHDREGATVLEGHELEVGRGYYILLTTSGGLYRYDIHDLVRCVGFEGTAPVLEFLSKGANFSSITGEKLSEHQVVNAVKRSFADLDLAIEHFTLAPVMDERPSYVLLMEPGPHLAKEELLARRLEEHLCELNCEYREKRSSGRLNALAVQQVPRGTWSELQRRRIAQQGSMEQYKHPCLVNDLEFVQRLLTAVPSLKDALV